MDMEINTKTLKDVTVVEVIGDIDGKTAPQVQDAVKAAFQAGGKLLLDLTKVPYMSSAGLRMMVGVFRLVSGGNGKMALVGVNDEIKETMDVTGFLSYFTIYATLDEGVEALQ